MGVKLTHSRRAAGASNIFRAPIRQLAVKLSAWQAWRSTGEPAGDCMTELVLKRESTVLGFNDNGLPPPRQQMSYTPPEEQRLIDKIIAESVACRKSEKLRSSSSRGRWPRRFVKLRAEPKAERINEMKADLMRMYEECKQAGVVVEVGAEDMAPDLRRHASERLPSECLPIIPSRRHGSGSVDVIRGSPVLSSLSGASSPLRPQEGLAQRIAAMQMIRSRHFEERWAPQNAADLGDRRQPDDPAGSRSGEGEIENTRLSIISLQDDCCGHTPRPRSFVMVDRRKKENGLAGLFSWLGGACHRASMLIPRTCARA